MASIGRRAYAEIFGPTVGDRVRLADTDLVIEVEADHTLRARRDAVAAGAHGASWTVHEGLILHDGRVFVPMSSMLLDDVL